MVDKTPDRQPRWPRGTPVAPGGKGPGGGRFRSIVAMGRWVAESLASNDDYLRRTFGEDPIDGQGVGRKEAPPGGHPVRVGRWRRLARPDAGQQEAPARWLIDDHGELDERRLYPDRSVDEEPVTHVYRAMSLLEWNEAVERGHIQSDGRGVVAAWEGTNAGISAGTARSYLPGGGEPAVIVRIAVHPDDEWFVIDADGYLRTRRPIPLDRVESVSAPLRMGVDPESRHGRRRLERMIDTDWADAVSDRLPPATPIGLQRDLTDAELDARADRATAAALSVPDTRTMYRPGGPGTPWSAEREAMHERILSRVYERHKNVPRDRQAIIAGGLPGAGKTTTLSGHGLHDYLPINGDDMKDEIITEGGVPDVPGADLSPMERNPLIQAEASHLAERLLELAMAEGHNVLLDTTMGDYNGPGGRARRLRDAGYSVRGMFVDVPIEVSYSRTAARYRADTRRWLNGEGHGGRQIPQQYIERSRGPEGGPTVNRAVFDQLVQEGWFDGGWELHDNSGDAPRLVDRGDRITPIGYMRDDDWLDAVTPRTVGEVLRARHPDIDVSVHQAPAGHLVLQMIRVPRELRGQGKARAALTDLVAAADRLGLTVALTPEPPAGERSSVVRLRKLYRSFGFVPNTGRSRDSTIWETMRREPVTHRV